MLEPDLDGGNDRVVVAVEVGDLDRNDDADAVLVRALVFVLVSEAVAVRVGNAVQVANAVRVLDDDGFGDHVANLVGNEVRVAVPVFVDVIDCNAVRVAVAVLVDVLDAVAVSVGKAPVSKRKRGSDSPIVQKKAR